MVAESSPVYRLEKVSLSYGAKAVLDEIDLTIEAGAWVGILGPNGCGKTSLLRLMAGVVRPVGGRIELYGQALSRYSPKDVARIVSVLPQENPLDFPFSAMEVVLMGRAPYLKGLGWESAEDRRIAHEAMELTDCLALAGEDIRLLSGGERERVFLARALAQKPRVLLLDEPTTHLDLKRQSEVYRLLKRLHRSEKLTILSVLHDLNFAAQACGKILVLSQGRIAAAGAPGQVLKADLIEAIFGVRLRSLPRAEGGSPLFLPDFSEP